ncbi:hypothetical protein EVAR_8640_1 [Eumeta japonica]|uniref:Uncharacterized protein n=1 Tax=Eumeta variegata TaxID=151549 RepID=A0A4C1TUF1_EUMVA|nr:hypothetical protein EVAR_8640_1 [Eumeta japonica]
MEWRVRRIGIESRPGIRIRSSTKIRIERKNEMESRTRIGIYLFIDWVRNQKRDYDGMETQWNRDLWFVAIMHALTTPKPSSAAFGLDIISAAYGPCVLPS